MTSHWPTRKLSQITEVNPSLPRKPDRNELVTIVPMAAVGAGTNAIDYSGVKAVTEAKPGLRPFIEGDVLLAKITPSMENGKVAVVRGLPTSAGFGSTEFHVLRCKADVTPRYLYYFLNQRSFRSAARRSMTGTAGQLRVPAKWLRDVEVPIPPKDIQETLIEEIEKQFTRLDFAADALRRSRVNLRRWKSSILRDSFSGSQLSSRPLGEICSVHIGATPSRTVEAYWRGDIPWVVSKDLHSRFIAETAECITEAGLDNTSTEVHPVGTVLLGMIGQGPTRGLAAMLKVPACTSQNLAALRPRKDSDVLPEWLLYWLDSQYEYLRSLGSGNNQKALNKKVVESILVPLPPVKEQRGAVERIEIQLSALEAIEQAVAVSASRQVTLRQKLLSDVFSGALLPASSSPTGDT